MTRWGKFKLSLCVTGALAATAGVARAELIKFDVVPAFAPNGRPPAVSPFWTNYVVNALTGIQNNIDIPSRDDTSAAYERVVAPVPPHEMIYTESFNSWRGTAAPNPDFASPFLGEYGNRVHFNRTVAFIDV